jgi:hypothetical protein
MSHNVTEEEAIHPERAAEVLLKHSIVPSERSLVPETCMELCVGALCIKDQVRQAKADFPLVLVD